MPSLKRIAFGLATINLPLIALAQPSELDTIQVDGTRMERSLLDTPAAVSVVEANTAQQGQQNIQLDETLARVPGLYLQNRYNFAQNQRLSIRGFGARAPFGVRGLRIRVDGFPETLPDGQSQVDNIDLDSIYQATVLRGPASVLYGNATGGVIDIESLSGRNIRGNGELSLSSGADGFRKAHLKSGGQKGNAHYYLGLSGLNYDGYRDQSAVEKYQLNSRVGWELDNHQEIDLFLTALDTPYAEDPSGLTRLQAHTDRKQSTLLADRLDAGQEVDQQRLGFRYRNTSLAGGLLQARAFISQRDFTQQLPFPGSSLIDYQRTFYGVGLEYHHDLDLFGLQHRYLIGVDVDRQQDDRGRQNVSFNGAITGLSANEDQTATSSGVFIQTDTFLTDSITLSLGARADRIQFKIKDDFLTDGNDSGKQQFNEGSFSAGVAWHAIPAHTLYASISSAFETPTFTELANPSGVGGFNPNLDPQNALNKEVGMRGTISDGLLYDMTLFSVSVKDEITPYELGGRTFYENAARTRREGMELSLEHFTTDTLTTTVAWTWAQYRFERFVDQQQGMDVSDNHMPGLPQHIVFAEAAWRPSIGIFVIGDVRFASSVYAENTNETRIGSHAVANARIGKRWDFNRQHLELHTGINNLFDREYYSNIRINANSDRPNPDDRGYFEPAPGRTLYAGMTYGW
jgi:iron complex outermembrane receptor protein